MVSETNERVRFPFLLEETATLFCYLSVVYTDEFTHVIRSLDIGTWNPLDFAFYFII